MRVCYLHIGGKKTGSTSIQYAIKHNQSALLRRGYYVGDHLGKLEDKNLANLLMNEEDENNYAPYLNYVSDLKKYQKDGINGAIISAESLCDLYIPEIERLYLLLNELFDCVQVVLFVRRQDVVAASHYSTALKGEGTSKRLMSLGMGKRGKRAFSFGSILRDWAHVFGLRNIYVRRYIERWEGTWDAVTDFLSLLPNAPSPS